MVNDEYFRKQMELKTYGIFESQDGQISFLGMLRVFEQGVNVFRIVIADRPPLYGEWQTKFEPNGNDLNVQIITFGYPDAYNVGNPYPSARVKLTRAEITSIKDLIFSIFTSDETRKGVFPFNVNKVNFLGGIGFNASWVSVE